MADPLAGTTIAADGRRYANIDDDTPGGPRDAATQQATNVRIKGAPKPTAAIGTDGSLGYIDKVVLDPGVTPTVGVKIGTVVPAAPAAGDLWIDTGNSNAVKKYDSKTVAIATTSTSTAITGTGFTAADVGQAISGTGIPAGATIASSADSTHAVLSAAATATGTPTATIKGWVTKTDPSF